jgi:hypothetical protein
VEYLPQDEEKITTEAQRTRRCTEYFNHSLFRSFGKGTEDTEVNGGFVVAAMLRESLHLLRASVVCFFDHGDTQGTEVHGGFMAAAILRESLHLFPCLRGKIFKR